LDNPAEFILTNAKVATAERVIDGWVAIARGRIVEVGEGRAPERGFDLDGDFAAPEGALGLDLGDPRL